MITQEYPFRIDFVSSESRTARAALAGGKPCQGLYWQPASERPRIAIIATHYNVDFSERYLARSFTERGIGFLGWNTRYRANEDLFMLADAITDISVGVRWLREVAGVETIVILGNSGGGSLMAVYQAEATEPSLGGPRARYDDVERLLPADLYISLNAHLGRPEVLTAWMDPSIADEGDPLSLIPELDPFEGENHPPYSAEFISRYRAAQVARNHRITAWAQQELARLQAAGTLDRIFPVFRCWADLRFMDPAIDPSDRPANFCYRGDPAKANRTPSIGRTSSLRTWLDMWSLETSNCKGASHLAKLAVPALVIQSTGDAGVFPSDARSIFDAIAMDDRELQLVPGAHYFEDNPAYREQVADMMAAWIRARV